MSHSPSSPRVYGIGRLLRLLRALRRPFVGHASGATFIEYLMLCGIVALGAILGFKRLRDRSDLKVATQAEIVKTLGATTPSPMPGSVLLPGPGGGVWPSSGITPPGVRRLPVIQPQCFAAGTPVRAEHGERAIEAIRVGEQVWARDEATGEDRLARVLQTYVTPGALVIGVDVPFDVGRSERLFVTPDHPFWVHERGWVAAQQLHGSLLEALAAEPRASSAALAARAPEPLASAVEAWGERTSVYNLEVEGLHTYFVGRARVLVHNKCGLAVKTYDEWHDDPKKPAGTEVNHLNQNAVYGTSHGGAIPRGQGASVPLTGSTHEPGTEHYKFHRSLENFWDLYRPGGRLENKLPTNAQYGAAVERALIDAGFSKSDAQRIASGARANRIAYGYKDNEKVPRVPGSFMGPDPDLK